LWGILAKVFSQFHTIQPSSASSAAAGHNAGLRAQGAKIRVKQNAFRMKKEKAWISERM
jgi:uncharacterized protein YacL (UPF0231 family)